MEANVHDHHAITPHRTSRSRARRALGVAGALIAGTLGGCVSDAPTKHTIQAAPSGTTPTALQMWVRTPVPDTDGNGFPDTLPVTVYLFAERYPLSLEVPGTFRFELYSAEGKLARVWTFDDDQARATVRRAGPGPAYVFALSLLDGGSDRVRRQTVDLSAVFTPDPGLRTSPATPVKARTTTIQIGG